MRRSIIGYTRIGLGGVYIRTYPRVQEEAAQQAQRVSGQMAQPQRPQVDDQREPGVVESLGQVKVGYASQDFGHAYRTIVRHGRVRPVHVHPQFPAAVHRRGHQAEQTERNENRNGETADESRCAGNAKRYNSNTAVPTGGRQNEKTKLTSSCTF